jgi:hypothetical protein
MAYQSAKGDTSASSQPAGKPAWLAPAIVVAVVLVLWAGAKKRDEVVDNPVVELAILTVGVTAMAAALAVIFGKLGSPGAASFFRPAPVSSASSVGSHS